MLEISAFLWLFSFVPQTSKKMERRAIVVAPPQRRVVNRKAPTAVPFRQAIVLASSEADLRPQEFSKNLNQQPDEADRPRKAARRESSGLVVVYVHAWQDTTLRELFEALMQQHADAATTWLNGGASPARRIRISHVYPMSDRKPNLESIGVLSVDGPVDSKLDLVTFSELMETSRKFKIGDLLAFSIEAPKIDPATRATSAVAASTADA